MSGNTKYSGLSLVAPPSPQQDIYLARLSDIMHLIESGSLIYTWLDLETTDKDWQTAEITVASLTITDIAYNLIADNLFEVAVPDRTGLSPEAMMITRYMAQKVRDERRLSPQKAAAQIFEAIQSAPQRLWDMLGSSQWQKYVAEEKIVITGRTGKEKLVRVRHFPALDDNNQIVYAVRVHEPQPHKDFMEMSYLIPAGEPADYEDAKGRWRVRQIDKYNLGFRNTFFDNRLMAAALFRANFPQKEIYALNRKSLGNHSADVFTAALTDYFFGANGGAIRLGQKIDAETSRQKISAKLDLLMEENTRHADADIGLPEGVRVYDGTLHNLKRGHNAPDYDNAKAIGLHRLMRCNHPHLVAQVERCGQIDIFRNFMTLDHEDGIPTTHPLRFAILSGNDDQIYRAVPLLVLGTDDQHGKFNRVWAMRADLREEDLVFEGKSILEMEPEEISALMRTQKGQPNALFHEIHLRRHRGIVTLQEGLRAGHCPGRSIESFRHFRDQVIDHLDERDRPFLGKALDSFALLHAYRPPADDIPQPYVEEEIWTAMGDIKYAYVTGADGKQVKLPNVIREMAQDEFKRLNDQIGDTLRALMRPQPLEWNPSLENAVDYAILRDKKIKKLRQYQQRVGSGDTILLPQAFYDEELNPQKEPDMFAVGDVLGTLIQDRLYLMDRCPSTTRSYDVERRLDGGIGGKSQWQRIPFPVLADMSEGEILALKDEGRLRVRFEANPNHPVQRFAIRYFMENAMADLLGQAHRDFYLAETAIYANGPSYIADPSAHRIMSIPKVLKAIEAIRQNVKPGDDFLSASRPGETGAGTMYRSDDFSEAILDSVHQDALRRQKKYPQNEKRKFMFGIDPQTDRPLLQVRYEIPDRHMTIQIPDTLVDNPAAHSQFGHLCLVIGAEPGLMRERHIVLEEERTGRRFYAAEPALFPLPDRRSGSYDAFYRAIDRAYSESGGQAPASGYVLSCAELAPIAKTRDPQHPSVRIAQNRLIATRNPELGGLRRDENLNGFLVRKYDMKLKKDQKIRLRGVDEEGQETGWEAVVRIRGKTEEFTLQELLGKLDDLACAADMDRLAYECGYGNADDLRAKVLAQFTSFDEPIGHPDNVLLFFRIAPVKRISYWTPHAPRACFERKLNDPDNAPETPPKAKLARKEPSFPTNGLH